MSRLTHLSLFSGIGGLDLAAEWAGFETVGQCEWAEYPTKVLEKHWPDVPRWRDIKTLTGEDFYAKTGGRTVDVISGGFPCQPFSVAGKQRGKEDDRYLWPEMVRVIKELRPTWVVGENVAGIINLALDDVLSNLEAEGYETRAFLVPVCGVGAPHQRYRTAIVAHSTGKRSRGLSVQRRGSQQTNTNTFGSSENVAYTDGIRYSMSAAGESGHDKKWNDPASEQSWRAEFHETVTSGNYVPNADSPNGERTRASRFQAGESQFATPNSNGAEWWAAEPAVGRVANGISNRVDRLRCLGNAVVPQQFYPIFQAIADIENKLVN